MIIGITLYKRETFEFCILRLNIFLNKTGAGDIVLTLVFLFAVQYNKFIAIISYILSEKVYVTVLEIRGDLICPKIRD